MKLKLLAHRELNEFPSGSGVEFHGKKLYIVGDDAKSLLITGKKWKKHRQVGLFDEVEDRIPKNRKPDLEATTIVAVDRVPHLCLIGSGSKSPRNRMVLFNLDTEDYRIVDIGEFYQRLTTGYLDDLNIEGAATVAGEMVLANRGNKAHPHNHLIVTDAQFWLQQAQIGVRRYRLDLGADGAAAGVSGLAYSTGQRRLWFTASTEDTSDSYDDGKIGKSYLGIIEHADEVLRSTNETIKADILIDLAAKEKQFKHNKIESVCIEQEKPKHVKLQLVADNDTGTTQVFRLKVKVKPESTQGRC